MSSSLSKLWERTAIVAAIAVGERTYCSIHSIQSVGTLLSLRQLPIECKSVRKSIGPWLTVYYELFNSRLLTDSFTILPVKLKLKISVVKKPLQFYGLLSWWLARLIRFEQLRYRTYTNVYVIIQRVTETRRTAISVFQRFPGLVNLHFVPLLISFFSSTGYF